jgi:hypothetical protein
MVGGAVLFMGHIAPGRETIPVQYWTIRQWWRGLTNQTFHAKEPTARQSASLRQEGKQMTTYRVSKAQSLRMRAFDKKAEAAEAKKVKAAEKKAKAEKKSNAG